MLIMRRISLAFVGLLLLASGQAFGQASTGQGSPILGGTPGSAPPGSANNVMIGVLDSAGNVGRLRLMALDGSSLLVNLADSNTASTALGANAAVITLPLGGARGAVFQLQSGGTGIYTVTPQCSFDGGVIYNAAGYILDPISYAMSLTAVIASAQATTDYPVLCPSGASHVQMKVTAYTSGTANWLARATTISPIIMNYGSDGTNIRALKTTTAGVTQADLSQTASNATPVNVGSSAANTNPTNTLTLPAATTAYTAGNMICTSATAATCSTAIGASQFFAIANSAGSAIIPRLRLTTNDATSTGWGAATITIDLWTTAPTFTAGGDRAAFLPATGAAGHLASFTCTMGAVWSDGVAGECVPATSGRVPVIVKLSSGTSIFWTAIASSGSGVTGASKVFTLTAEVMN